MLVILGWCLEFKLFGVVVLICAWFGLGLDWVFAFGLAFVCVEWFGLM